MEGPVKIGTSLDVLEDCTLGKVNLKKGLEIWVAIDEVHKDPNQWMEPYKFEPERFNPDSEWFLTPDKKKRHPFAYIPFNGGRRICLGKTFAETQIRMVIPILLTHFEFELSD